MREDSVGGFSFVRIGGEGKGKRGLGKDLNF